MNRKDQTIAVFCCENSGLKALQGIDDRSVLQGTEAIPLPCSGKIEIGLVLKTLEAGYAGVLILGCPKDNCKFIRGNFRAEKRMQMLQASLDKAGISKRVVEINFLSSLDSHKCVQVIEEMKARVFTEEGVKA